MGLDVFLITDYTFTWYHIHLFASSAWLDFSQGWSWNFAALWLCLWAMSVAVILGIVCERESLQSKRSRDFSTNQNRDVCLTDAIVCLVCPSYPLKYPRPKEE